MSIDFCDAGHVISTEATFASASDGYFDHLWPYEQVVALHLLILPNPAWFEKEVVEVPKLWVFMWLKSYDCEDVEDSIHESTWKRMHKLVLYLWAFMAMSHACSGWLQSV